METTPTTIERLAISSLDGTAPPVEKPGLIGGGVPNERTDG